MDDKRGDCYLPRSRVHKNLKHLNPISWILANIREKRDHSTVAFTTAEHNRSYDMRCYKCYARGHVVHSCIQSYTRVYFKARIARVHVRARR